jgi:hypothetical protein
VCVTTSLIGICKLQAPIILVWKRAYWSSGRKGDNFKGLQLRADDMANPRV